MPSNHLTLCHPLFLLPSIFPSIRVFSHESALCSRWPKYWSFSFSISPPNEHPGLISFRMDWLDLLTVQGTLKSLLQHDSLKASVLRRSVFFIVQLSHPYMMLKHSQSTFILLSYLIRVFDPHRYRWREAEPMKDFAYVCNILKTKKKERNQPETLVHIQLCIFLCLIVFYISFQRGMSIILGVENYLLLRKSKQSLSMYFYSIFWLFFLHTILFWCFVCFTQMANAPLSLFSLN